MDRIREYGYKALVLRQIMSNQSRKYAIVNATQNILTVVLTSFLGFLGFSGLDKIQTYLGWTSSDGKLNLEMGFNLTVFGLFVLATLHLVFRFGEKQSDAVRAIVRLTGVINHIDDLLSKEEQGAVVLNSTDLDSVRKHYDIVTESIPANSDRDFLNAKKDVEVKQRRSAQLTLTPQALFDESLRLQSVKSLILKSDELMRILKAIRASGATLYLGGGLIRNLVWDQLHGFKSPTPVDDVDVIRFDSLNATKEHDTQIESTLRGYIPNLEWSVKNQARMMTSNGDAPYVDLVDAVAKWPETATCIAVRLTNEGELDLVVPHGLADLFRLLVRPTPNFVDRPERVLERLAKKKWEVNWPKLEVLIADRK